MKKFLGSYNNIISVENLLLAWTEFLAGKKQRLDVALFQNHLMDNVLDLHRELATKSYRHGGYKAFNISDPKPRIIHKAAVRDRLLHHLLYAQLYPYFDTKFIHDSYSCRVGKGTHKAINRLRDFGRIVSKNNTQTCWILKCDIRKFFASIDHDILKNILLKHIEDRDLLELLFGVIDSFVTDGQVGVGLPLGNLTSQLLVNVYMNEFDNFMKRNLKIKYYIRYADDFVIVHDDQVYLTKLVDDIAEFLRAELNLTLHPDKLFIKTWVSGLDFLGWINFPKHRVVRTATKKRALSNLKRNAGNDAMANSYIGLFSHGNAYGLIAKINFDFFDPLRKKLYN